MIVREVTIEGALANDGKMFVSSSEALASTVNRHSLASEESHIIGSSPFAALDARLDLRDIWFDGETSGEKLVVSYIQFAEEGFC